MIWFLVAIGIAVLVTCAAWASRSASRPLEGGQYGPAQLKAMTVGSFLALSSEDRVTAMIAQIRATQDAAFGAQTILNFIKEASRHGAMDSFRAIWLDLLRGSDPRMRTRSTERLTSCGPGGVEVRTIETEDDSWFKEQLLYVIRDNTPPENATIDDLFALFPTERHPMTRMRLVRAIGTIGGARSRPMLDEVVAREAVGNTHAAQEAAAWLAGKGASGGRNFTGPKDIDFLALWAKAAPGQPT